MSHEEQFFFFSSLFPPSSFPFFFFFPRNARTGYKSGSGRSVGSWITRADISGSGRNIQVSLEILEKSATHSWMIESLEMKWKFFPPFIFFFLFFLVKKEITKFVKQAMNRSIAINAERYFENMFFVYQLTNNLQSREYWNKYKNYLLLSWSIPRISWLIK